MHPPSGLRARVPALCRPRGRLLRQHFFLHEHLEEQERVGDVVDVVEAVQLGVPGADEHVQEPACELGGERRGALALALAARGHGGRRGCARARKRHATRVLLQKRRKLEGGHEIASKKTKKETFINEQLIINENESFDDLLRHKAGGRTRDCFKKDEKGNRH